MGVLDTLRRGIIAKPSKRKRTKKEAKERIRSIPTVPPFLVPPIARPVVRGVPLLAEALVDLDPLGLTAPAPVPKPVIPTTDSQPRQQRQQEVTQMTTEDTVRDMVNDPMITITEDMLPIINDPGILMDMNGRLIQNQFSQAALLREPKKKRKVSKYQKELGRQLKALKKKHPRIPISSLMKRAHRATKRALK